MATQKRIRPMMNAAEAFRVPQIILLPAAAVSCALIPLALMVEPVSLATVAGAIFAALVFTVLMVFVLLVPALSARTLKQNGLEGTATILKREKRARTLITPQYRSALEDSIVLFEFIPQGASSTLQLEAEVGRLYSKLAEGKTVKIRYASSNPRIVRFQGE